MKLNKKVIDSITVCGLCAMLTVTAVTNSGRSEVKAEDKVLANTGLEHTGYNSYAGVAATLFDYEKGLTAENAVTVEKENVEMVAAAQDAQQEVQPQLTQQQEWQTKLMPKVEESLNVRAQADEQSDIVGKLYKGSVADIVENDGTWAHIKSGNVDGYVNVSYCVTGTDALSYAYDTCGEIATVNTDGLRVRETADTNSKALDVADQGKTYQVDRAAQAPDGWIAVVSDSQTGYIAADYATRSLNTRVGITIEEEQAQIAAQKEAERKAAAEAAKAAKKNTSENTSSKKAETTQGEAVSAGADDLTLLAAIIECEAGGESYECQLAVGAAVINRVKSSSYPNSISGVIYQKGQFGPASSGKLARKLSGSISSSCYSAAQEAMSGVDNTGGCTSFNDHGSGISIGNMKFR